MDERRIYCVVPGELAGKLHDVLRKHFADDPAVEVVVERRSGDRRSGGERRAATGKPPGSSERRFIRAQTGRRIAEQRAPTVVVDAPRPLPRRARRHADQIAFVERLEPARQQLEDEDTARLIARFQAGEIEVFNAIYRRHFDRVYGYIRVALRDSYEAEDLTQQVFLKVLEALPRYERRSQPFRAWLFRVVRNEVISHFRREGVVEAQDPAEIAEHGDDAAEADIAADSVLAWISDRDLMVFVERLPLFQRQILLLSFGLDMSAGQIAEILDTNPAHIRSAKRYAVAFLRARLTAIGRTPERDIRQRPRMRRWGTPAQVLRRRRFALLRH